MVRRAVAALLMLVAAVLVHAVTPHHAWTAPRVNAASHPQDQVHSTPHLMFEVQAPSSLHDDQQDPLALPNRVQNSPLALGAVDGSQTDGAVPETHDAIAASHPATARDRHRPTGAAAPTPSTLQTFRC
ncbi:hypothetical protein KQY30_33760 [Streptomyces sp. GMY02]|uniref:hypothetical protein n=1 Tax=Streptomyces sp. GMY02 TaxID=1333528 RepID=UPI001C2BAF64|nr:hypothetical protein [Streptomyces sp. GMY02]QXE38464.1 hypothetical protein KQY30_33760 [Streptomyces sp. GMY02]